MENHKTSRILWLFQMFYHCKEVSRQDIFSFLSTKNISVKERTIKRDMQLLKNAGLVRYKYSKGRNAYVPLEEDGDFVARDGTYLPLEWPEDKKKKQCVEKILRLCTLMTEVFMKEVENPVKWYHTRYPNLCDRTRQRDFEQLRAVDYEVVEDEMNPGRFEYYYPPNVYYEVDFYNPVLKLLRFLNSVDDCTMPAATKLIRQSLKEGTFNWKRYHQKFSKREVSKILYIGLVAEKEGNGIRVICDNGMGYRFVAVDRTTEKLLEEVETYSQRKAAHETLNFARSQAVQYYEAKVDFGYDGIE